MTNEPMRYCCKAVKYRQGFLEVTGGIHRGCVSLEVFDVTPEKNLDGIAWVTDPGIVDADVLANIELELTASQAESLGHTLLELAAAARTP